MARPTKHTVDYFPHDADASEGRTLSILFNNFGHEGISCWWQLLERISRTNNHVISLRNGEDMEYLSAKLHFQPGRLEEILSKLAELGAIDKDLYAGGIIWSMNFVDRVEQVYRTRKQEIPSKPTLQALETKLSTPETNLSTPETPHTILKETILNKLKNTTSQSFETFWNKYPKRKSKGVAEKAFAKVNPDEQLLSTMLTSIDRAKKSEDWQKDDGKYIPYPATWLNAKGWEDEIREGQYGTNRGNAEKSIKHQVGIRINPE